MSMESRSGGSVRGWLAIASLVALLSALPAAARAQGTLRGVVIDSMTRAPVSLVSVAIVALHIVGRGDDSGRFVFTRLPRGEVELSIRRMGYQPQRERIILTGGSRDSVLIVLVPHPATLSGVEVSAGERRRRQMVEDFYQRMARGIGTYITRDDLEARHARLPTDALNLPGIRLVHTRYGTSIRFVTGSNVRRDCAPNVWVDGQRAPGLELDDISVNDIEGIELYNGPSTTPAQFWQGNLSNSGCGTIVVWSRVPGA